MDSPSFPWLKAVPDLPELPPETERPPPSPTPSFLSAQWRKAIPFLAFFACVALLFYFKEAPSPRSQGDTYRYVDVLVVMLATPKGTALLPATLKQIPVDRKSLSKSQMLQLVRLDDLIKVQSHLRTKKDLPPNKPLFWSDLELRKPETNTPKQQIFYSQEG